MDNPDQGNEPNSLADTKPSVGGDSPESLRPSDLDGSRNLAGRTNEAASTLKTKAAGMIEPVKEHAAHVAEEQISNGAAKVEGVARAVHEAADKIEEEIPRAGTYVHDLADGLERASHAVRERSLGDIVGAIDDFAHRQPAAFFGAAVLTGFVLTRFLKTSGHSRSGDDSWRPRSEGGNSGSGTEYGAPRGGGMPS